MGASSAKMSSHITYLWLRRDGKGGGTNGANTGGRKKEGKRGWDGMGEMVTKRKKDGGRWDGGKNEGKRGGEGWRQKGRKMGVGGTAAENSRGGRYE